MPHAQGQLIENCAGDWARLATDQSAGELEELSPANITIVACPIAGEDGIVRVAVINAGPLGFPELVANEALNKSSFCAVVLGVKTKTGVVTAAEVESL